MAGKDFFSNPLVKKVIENFKKDGLNLCFSEDDQNWDITFFDSEFAKFSKQTGKTEDFLLDTLKNDYDDFLAFVKEQSKDSDEILYAFLFGSDLLLFAILRYDLEIEGAFLSGKKNSYLKDAADSYNKLFRKKGEKAKTLVKTAEIKNPYKGMDKKELTKEYFALANEQLPGILAEGFTKAIQKFKKTDSDENEICCILDIGKKPKMVFAHGDGTDCDDSTDESVFFKYPCDETLTTCALMVDTIETLNMRQESSHWLTDALNIAQEKGVFKDLSVTIYGNVQYGDHELDVIYES